jgi:hypothetical protein
MFFESRGWLDSDCEDDFHSVNGGNHITRHAYQLSKRDFIQVLECYILVCKLYWLFILILLLCGCFGSCCSLLRLFYYYHIISSVLACGLFAPSVKSKLHVL